MSDPRGAVAQLRSLLSAELGDELVGLYLFGSLPAGGFVVGRSDIDLFAVTASAVQEGPRFDALAALHEGFVSAHTQWVDRVEIGYVSRVVLQTLADAPSGRIAVISPGEPFNVKEVEDDWVLNWHAVCTRGDTLLGPAPLELGPAIGDAAFKRAITTLVDYWSSAVHERPVAYVPAHRGYVAVTLCRALYGLETGDQTTKEEAVEWASARYPEWAAFLRRALEDHRADVREAHRQTVAFAAHAAAEADRLNGN